MQSKARMKKKIRTKHLQEESDEFFKTVEVGGPIFNGKRELSQSPNTSTPQKILTYAQPVLLFIYFLLLRTFVYCVDGAPTNDSWKNIFNFFSLSICALIPWTKTRRIGWACACIFTFVLFMIQAPKFLQSRSYYHQFMSSLPKDLEVHAYWGLRHIPTWTPWPFTNFRSIQTLRARRIYEQFPTRDDFKIEKSKCYMYRYMQNANIPHGVIRGYFNNSEEFSAWLGKQESYPMVVKFCHLTQGSQQCPEKNCPAGVSGNTFFLAKKATAESTEFKNWVDYRWPLLAEDPGRPWEEYMREPLHSVPAGIFVQGAFPLFKSIKKPFEIKVTVFWGQAYMGRFENGPTSEWERCKVYFQNGYEVINEAPWPYDKEMGTDFDIVPHLKCVKDLAEHNAKVLKMDFIRVDIFMNPKNPAACAINEHSIFEPNVGHHNYHMMRAWTDPYLRNGVKTISANIPSYEMGAQNPKQNSRPFEWKVSV